MSILGKIADIAASALTSVAGLSSPSAWSVRVADRLASLTVSVSDDLEYRFSASSPLLLWRSRTVFQKEPETISWIRTFTEEDVFFDVGANVGIFTIYAGRRGARVLAFEPEATNYAILNRNIALNRLSDRVQALPIAIADRFQIDSLHLASNVPGSALHAFGANVDFKGDSFKPAFSQGCLAMSLDELVERHELPQPTRIKIDVDGLERAVISGAMNVIKNPRLRDILIEINENDASDRAMITMLEQAGFLVIENGAPVADEDGKFRMVNKILRRVAS